MIVQIPPGNDPIPPAGAIAVLRSVDMAQHGGYPVLMTPTQIKDLRGRLEMTQEEFARKLGLDHRASVSRLESGARDAAGPLLALLRLLDQSTPAPVRRN